MTWLPAPLRRRGFLALWVAQVISSLGDRLYEIALIWLVYEGTGDPLAVAIVTFASVCSAAIATVPAGSTVDRVDRRIILIVSHLIRGVAVLAIPLVGVNENPLVLLVGVALVSGVAEAFFGPARNALIPEVVSPDELDSANSLSYITQNASQVLYALGGLAVGVFGAMTAFTLDSITFFVAAAALLAIPPADRRPVDSTTGTDDHASESDPGQFSLADFRIAFRLIRENEYLPSIILLSILSSLAIGPIGIVMPFYIEALTTPSSVVFGLLYASFFLGMFVGGIALTSADSNLSRGKQITLGTILSGLALVGMAAVPPLVASPVVVAAILFLISGVFTIFIKIPIRTYIQLAVPNEHLGKVLAVLNLSMLVAPPISIAVAGVLLEVLDPIIVLASIGGTVTVAGVVALATPLWRAKEPGDATTMDPTEPR